MIHYLCKSIHVKSKKIIFLLYIFSIIYYDFVKDSVGINK